MSDARRSAAKAARVRPSRDHARADRRSAPLRRPVACGGRGPRSPTRVPLGIERDDVDLAAAGDASAPRQRRASRRRSASAPTASSAARPRSWRGSPIGHAGRSAYRRLSRDRDYRRMPARPRAADSSASSSSRASDAAKSSSICSPSSTARTRANERRWNARDPVLLDPAPMVERRVAGVVLPAVVRVARGEPVHEPVADDLGDDRGGRDRVALRVAADDRRVGADVLLEAVDAQPVDQHVLALGDAADRAAHGEVRGVVDVDPVDLGHARRADADGHRAAADRAGRAARAGRARASSSRGRRGRGGRTAA